MTSIAEVPPSAALADKVEWLIQNMWPAGAPAARSNLEAAAAIADTTGEDISSTTIWKLRTGRQDNPQMKTLTALATFFHIPFGYFGFPTEATPIEEDLTFTALRHHVQNGTVRHDVLRALLDLTPHTRAIVDEMILSAARSDQAPRTPPGD
ncbi:hypothetical protein [Actinomadura xylanilytica]|uniref:hypothetical protein n=1 Tax=Actinomadura xylanilytica TaxID=887459 RepID=UPI00255A757E|nr:hypothetical protein [Actinomadura xylanilytica]MDL4770699.1 hypothetical protein [Actinomadura xylanilytica]